MKALRAQYTGNEAEDVFLEVRPSASELRVFTAIQSISYRIFLGETAQGLITQGHTELAEAIQRNNLSEVKEAFSRSRRRFDRSSFAHQLVRYKTGALRRTIRIAQLDQACGHIVDIGAGDNGLGQELVALNPDISVVGVDVLEGQKFDGPRLSFVKQDKPNSVPLESAVADAVVLRFSLHHMTCATQNSILKECHRLIKENGTMLIIEDTFSNDKIPYCTNVASVDFSSLVDDDARKRCLTMLDASSCFLREEEMAFSFTFKSMSEWRVLLEELGFDEISSEFWGLPFFSLFQAPLGVMKFRRRPDSEPGLRSENPEFLVS